MKPSSMFKSFLSATMASTEGDGLLGAGGGRGLGRGGDLLGAGEGRGLGRGGGLLAADRTCMASTHLLGMSVVALCVQAKWWEQSKYCSVQPSVQPSKNGSYV